MQTEDEEAETLSETLANLCRCVVCQCVCVELYTCANGHLTCKECIVRQAATSLTYDAVACAMCRDSSVWSHSLITRQLLSAIEERVGNFIVCDHEGCEKCVSVTDMETHRMCCPRRPTVCPHRSCVHETCLPMEDLIPHLVTHDDVLCVRAGEPVTFFASNLSLERLLVVRHGEEQAAFHLDCTAAVGRPGPFETQLAFLRLCCLTPGRRKWEATLSNRTIDGLCKVYETTHVAVPAASTISSCRAVAHPMITGYCGGLLEAALVHVGADVKDWWHSPEMRDVRRNIRHRGDAFPRSIRRPAEVAATLITLVIE